MTVALAERATTVEGATVVEQQLRLQGLEVELTPVAIVLTDPGLSYAKYESLTGFLGRVKRSSSWWLGDALIFGEDVYGEKFAQAASETGLSEQTLLHYMFVCQRVPADRREPSLSFGCHAAVARRDAKEQKYWLQRAAKGNWSEEELRARMKAKRAEERPQLVDPDDQPSPEQVIEVAKAILRDAKEHPDDPALYTVPREDVVRLRAVLGEEE